jgi:TPR repeat protein
VRRSGKSTEDGIRLGRRVVSNFLGWAYLAGQSVARDPGRAAQWLQQAAAMGSRSAQARLGSGTARTALGSGRPQS